MPEQQDKFGRYALVLLAAGALVRLIVMASPHPFTGAPPIDDSYFVPAHDILQLNFCALGDRAPVYPLLVALCGINPRAIWVAQSTLGVAASLMIFDMAFRRTRHALFSLFVGLACSLIPEVLVYEASVLTETLTNFLLVTSLWIIVRNEGTKEGNIRYPLALGAVVSLAGLTRPLMLCLAPVYYIFLVSAWPPTKILRHESLRRTVLFALPVIVLIFGWCGFNYFNYGYFTPTTRAGQQLMDQVDPYVDLAPDRFALLRDIWVHSRPQSLSSPNSNNEVITANIEEAFPEMERRTGKTESQIFHELASLALYLEIHHPFLCLRRAEQGWIQFWGQPMRTEVEWPPDGSVRLLGLLTTMAHFLVRELKATFLVLALLSIPFALFRPKTFTEFEYLAFAIPLCVSVCAAFTEYGENRRFCVPLYMLIVYTLLARAWVWITTTPPKGSGLTSDRGEGH